MICMTESGSIGTRMEKNGFKGLSRMVFGKANGPVGGKMEGSLKRKTLNLEIGTARFNSGTLTKRKV